MKETHFKWAWDLGSPKPDPDMSRARAASLLRSWRRTHREHPGWPIKQFCRVGPGVYRIVTRGAHVGTLIIGERCNWINGEKA